MGRRVGRQQKNLTGMPDEWAGGMADIGKISRKREFITPRCYDLPFKVIEREVYIIRWIKGI